MALNLGALPTSKFNKTFEPAKAGVYYGTVSKTEMRTSQTGKEYLSVTIDLSDAEGKKKGKMFDMFFDSDKSFVLYKLRRFVTACNIPCEGEMTLKDLGLLANGARMVVWTQEDEWNGKTRLVPNLRDAEGYYPATSFVETYNIWAAVEGKDGITLDCSVPEGMDEEIPFASDVDEF